MPNATSAFLPTEEVIPVSVNGASPDNHAVSPMIKRRPDPSNQNNYRSLLTSDGILALSANNRSPGSISQNVYYDPMIISYEYNNIKTLFCIRY